jgi:hypothetical protein
MTGRKKEGLKDLKTNMGRGAKGRLKKEKALELKKQRKKGNF